MTETDAILALADSDPAVFILRVADLREQRASSVSRGHWYANNGYVLCNSGDPTDGVNVCAALISNAEHIAAEANPTHALAAARHWRGVVERHSLGCPDQRAASVPCDDLTETADEARAYLGGAA